MPILNVPLRRVVTQASPRLPRSKLSSKKQVGAAAGWQALAGVELGRQVPVTLLGLLTKMVELWGAVKLPNASLLLRVTAPDWVVTVTGLSGAPSWLSVKVALLPVTEPELRVTPLNRAGLLFAAKLPLSVPPLMFSPELALAPPSRLLPLLVRVQQLLVTRPLTWPPVRLMAPLLELRVPPTWVPVSVMAPWALTLPLTWLAESVMVPLPLLTEVTVVPLRLMAPEAEITEP